MKQVFTFLKTRVFLLVVLLNCSLGLGQARANFAFSQLSAFTCSDLASYIPAAANDENNPHRHRRYSFREVNNQGRSSSDLAKLNQLKTEGLLTSDEVQQVLTESDVDPLVDLFDKGQLSEGLYADLLDAFGPVFVGLPIGPFVKHDLRIQSDLFDGIIPVHIQVRESFDNADQALAITDPISNTVLAAVDYSVSTNLNSKKSLTIVNTFVRKPFRRMGLFKFMLAYIFQQNPEIESTVRELASTNKSVLLEALNDGLPLREAVKRTPAFKANLHLGFTNFKVFEKRAHLHHQYEPDYIFQASKDGVAGHPHVYPLHFVETINRDPKDFEQFQSLIKSEVLSFEEANDLVENGSDHIIYKRYLDGFLSKESYDALKDSFGQYDYKVLSDQGRKISLPIQNEKISGSVDLILHSFKNKRGHNLALTGPDDRRLKALMIYSYDEEDKRMYILSSSVLKPLRRLGMFNYLLQQAIKEHPDVQILEADLAGDNFKIIKSLLRQRNSLDRALKSTPVYKSASRLGFSEIDFLPEAYQNNYYQLRLLRTNQ